jgi:metal-responsive CopG/Arc/MetJ family transcriptional regulator
MGDSLIIPVSSRLTNNDLIRFDKVCQQKKLTRSEFIRNVLYKELDEAEKQEETDHPD